MLIGWFLIALAVIIALIMIPRIRRWLESRKSPQQKSPPNNYQCSLYDEKAKLEACEELMAKGESKDVMEKKSTQK